MELLLMGLLNTIVSGWDRDFQGGITCKAAYKYGSCVASDIRHLILNCKPGSIPVHPSPSLSDDHLDPCQIYILLRSLCQ